MYICAVSLGATAKKEKKMESQNMLPPVKMEGREKGAQEQKKLTETHEAARMQGSFLFVGTAEGALYRIPCLALAHRRTHTFQTHTVKPPMESLIYTAQP